MKFEQKTRAFWVLAIVGFLAIGLFYWDPMPEPASVVMDKDPPRGFDWEQDESVDHWELWVSEGPNPDSAKLKATVTEPTATCEDVQVCGKDRYIHVRAVSHGLFSQFATIHWPSL